MAAKLGIEIPPINDASLRSLVDMLSKVPDIAEKMSQAFVTADGVITRSRETANEKIKGEIAKLAAAGEAAAQREIASAEATSQKLAAIAARDAEKAAALAQKTAERAAQIAAKQTERAEAESAKILAALERSKQKELESAAKADEKLAALQKKQEERANAAAQKEADRAAKSKGRTAAELEEQLNLHSKSNKEIVALQHRYAEEVADVQKKLTLTLDGEEKKRLQSTQAELKSELAAVKHEAEDRGLAEKHKSEGGEHKGGGISVGEVVGIGAAVEGFKMLKENAEGVEQAEKALIAGTGQTGKQLEETAKDAENIGRKFAISGEDAEKAMGKVASYTGATGEDLKKQTEAVVAYGLAHGKNAEMVAKQFATDKGRAKIMAEAELNVAKAQQAASTPAANMARIQNELMETVGKLAMTILDSFGPAIQAVVPVVEVLGKMLGDILKPILDKISPVIAMIAKGFGELAPIVMDLVTGALDLLLPILTPLFDVLKTMIPIIVDVAKQVGTALKPVFAALTPIIQQLAGVFSGALVQILKAVLIPVLQTLMPILTDVFVPVLMSLMPLLKLVTDIVAGVLTPALNILTGVFQFIISNAIQPLIKWLSGTLTTTIQGVVAVVTKVAGAISSIVSTVGGLLGMSDKAKDSVKETGEKVGEQQKENNDIAHAAQMQAQLKTENEHKKHLLELLKAKKLSAAEEAELRDLAQENEDAGLLAKLDAFDQAKQKRAESAGKKAASAAKKTAKEKYDAERAAADEAFTDEQTAIELRIANNEITAKVGRSQTLANVAKHNESLLAIANTYHIKVKAAQLAQLKDLAAQRKDDFDGEVRDLQEKEAADVEAAGDDSRKVYEIKKKSLEDQITSAKENGQETRALEKQLASFTLAERRTTTSEDKKLSQELAKFKIDQQKEEIANMKAAGMDAKVIRDAETQAAIQEEKLRFDAELESRKHDLDNTKLGHALLEALEINHQNKLVAITKTAETEKRKEQRDTLDKITGASQIYGQAEQAIHAKFFGPMLDDWKQQKTFGMQALATIAEGVLKYFEEWAAKHAAMLASQLADIVVASTASIAAAETTGAAWAPAAAFSSTATLGGAAVTGSAALSASVAGAHALGFLAEGTDYWRGGPSVIGENGPEIMNLPRGTQVIPNHKLSSVGHAPVDMSPLLSEMRSMNRTLNNVHGAVRNQRTVLPINDNIRSLFNQSEKAEARRSA